MAEPKPGGLMDARLRPQVRERAGHRCEYCHLRQAHQPASRFHIEHIIPCPHGGRDDETNLALACFHCNRHKGTNLTGIDPESLQVVRLFNPRQEPWAGHFAWRGIELVGLPSVGRTTLRALKMNAPRRLELRTLVLVWSGFD